MERISQMRLKLWVGGSSINKFLDWIHIFTGKPWQDAQPIIVTFVLVIFQNDYGDSKLYPMFPRYNILKDMIKDVTHHPDYMEHRHESRVPPD